MAAEGKEPEEYESDPEGSPLPLTMRRREASDDEEGEGEKSPPRGRIDARVGIASDGESDGQGGAQVYDDEDEEEEVEDEEEAYEEEDVEEDGAVREVEYDERANAGNVNAGDDDGPAVVGSELGADGQSQSGDLGNGQNQNGEEEKKESEPFSVPTAGAFYMHDDRFRDSAGGRHRRPGGRKLWESRDDRAWVHDRFEEMNLQDAHYDEDRRTHRGQFRGRGKKRGSGRGFVRASRTRGYDENSTQNRAPKTVRGRGPRRYESFLKNNNDHPPTQRKQYGKISEITTNATLGRTTTNQSNVQAESVASQKHVFASSLSSASPPFYPSGASTQDVSLVQKRDSQGPGNHKSFSMLMEENLPSASHSNTLLRGKGVAGTLGQDKIYVEDSAHSVATRPLVNMQPANMGQSSHSRVHGRGVSMSGPLPYQPASSTNQVTRAPVQMQQVPATSQKLPQSPAQPVLRASTQQVSLRMASGNQTSPSQGPSVASSEAPEVESPPGSAKHKMALVAKGKAGTQGAGRGSFLYNGTQIIAATGGHGDQSFSATPALLPVMQFGAQHPGGLGMPAVGMALPGYVAQPQLGFGNSEMTWVPVLAGAAAAAGALGASPFQYIAVDGGYYGRPSGQAPSSGVSKEASPNKPSNNVWKPPQRAELVNDEFGQRQNKPRRYSEMNFGQ